METEKFELMLDEAQANAALEKGMLYADTFVNKNYLINLDRYPLVELDSAEKSDEYIRLYQIERIVYDVDENANDKLISVYSAFFNIQAAGLLVIKSTRNALGFYIGVRSVDNTSTAEAILEKSFKGNFAGSQIQAIPQEEVQKVLGSINKSGRFGTRQNVSSVSIVPSTRDEDKERFVQGIEKFIDTMKGSEYTAVFIAEPLDKEILEQAVMKCPILWGFLTTLSLVLRFLIWQSLDAMLDFQVVLLVVKKLSLDRFTTWAKRKPQESSLTLKVFARIASSQVLQVPVSPIQHIVSWTK